MLRINLLAMLMMVAGSDVSRAQGRVGGFGGPTFAPVRGYSAPNIGFNATTAPHSAPFSIFPGPGPTTPPPALFFPGFRPIYPNFGYYGGAYPIYYSNSFYNQQATVITIEPPWEPILRTARTPDNPITGMPPRESPSPTRARLLLTVPANAEVVVNTQRQTSRSTLHVLESHELREGEQFKFDLVVRWIEAGETVEEKRSLSIGVGESQSLTFIAGPARPARSKN